MHTERAWLCDSEGHHDYKMCVILQCFLLCSYSLIGCHHLLPSLRLPSHLGASLALLAKSYCSVTRGHVAEQLAQGCTQQQSFGEIWTRDLSIRSPRSPDY